MGPSSTNQPVTDIWLNEYKDQLPPTLNILTILTIICSAFTILAQFITFAWAPISYRNAANAQDTMDQLPPLVKSLLGNTRDAARIAYLNRVPILLIGLLAALLCLFGALQMRKRKRSGFILYILGDLMPLISLIFFTLVSTLVGVSAAIGYGVSLLFVILYATQLKYMK